MAPLGLKGRCEVAPADPNHLSSATKIITNFKNHSFLADGALPYLHLHLWIGRDHLHTGGAISTLQMWKLRLGRALEVPGLTSVVPALNPGLLGRLQSSCFLTLCPPVPSSEQGVCPACLLHPQSQAYGH